MTLHVNCLLVATTITPGVSSLPPVTTVQPELPPAVLNLHNNCDESKQESRVESADVSTCPYRMDHIKSLLRLAMTCLQDHTSILYITLLGTFQIRSMLANPRSLHSIITSLLKTLFPCLLFYTCQVPTWA